AIVFITPALPPRDPSPFPYTRSSVLRFTLSALIGSAAGDSSDLFTGPAQSRRVALGIDRTFLDHGRVKARIDAAGADSRAALAKSEEHTSELQSRENLVCRLLLEKNK